MANTEVQKTVSIVVPCYNEDSNLNEFYQEIGSVIAKHSDIKWTLCFVDDGSSDNTWASIADLAQTDDRISGVRLTRNFGKEVAMTAGAQASVDADAVIFIDADLQHPPHLIDDLILKWKEGGKIVAAKRVDIDYSILRRIGANLFYWTLTRFSSLRLEPKTTDFQILDREVVEVLLSFEERARFFRGIIDWTGFKKEYVEFSAPLRFGGRSKFKIRDLIRLAVNSITSFSMFPLRIAGYLGLLVLFLSSLVLFYMVVAHVILALDYFSPIAYFVVFNTFLFGVVLAAIGLTALYIGQIHNEVVGRPLYIVSERIG